jgi:hypothetical protein
LLLLLYQAAQKSLWRSGNLSLSNLVDSHINLTNWLITQLFLNHQKDYFLRPRTLYFGIPLLVLFGYLLFRLRHSPNAKKLTSFAILTILGLLMSSWLVKYIYFVPVLNWFRWPFKYYPLFLFFLIVSTCLYLNSFAISKLRKSAVQIFLLLILISNILIIFYDRGPDQPFTPHSPKIPVISKYPAELQLSLGRVIPVNTYYQLQSDHSVYLETNFPTLLGYYGFAGWDATVSEDLVGLSLGLFSHSSLESNLSQGLLDYLSLWGVRSLIIPNEKEIKVKLDVYKQLQNIYVDSQVIVYRNTAAQPLVYFASQPNLPLTYNIETNKIIVETNLDTPQVINFNFASLPNYKVYIDGHNSNWIKTEVGQIQAFVPPHTTEVVLQYTEPTFTNSIWLTLIGIALTGIYLRNLKSN